MAPPAPKPKSLLMGTPWDFSGMTAELALLNANIVDQDPKKLGSALNSFVCLGSQLHLLHIDAIKVYGNPDGSYEGKEEVNVLDVGEYKVAQTAKGLLAAGAKFLDAIIYLSLPVDKRPPPAVHMAGKTADDSLKYSMYDDNDKIIKYIFAVWFYIMIRGHPPSRSDAYKDQPTPRFISAVLGIKEGPASICNYLASFPLEHLDPNWVRHINLSEISGEALNRIGLGVAGYRMCSVFNTVVPDEDAMLKSPLSRAQLEASLVVAKSFLDAGFCWDFHPATRSTDVLMKYGNVNKNLQNLLRDVYNEDTLKRLKQIKKIYDVPAFDEGHCNYRFWTEDMAYKATALIFKK